MHNLSKPKAIVILNRLSLDEINFSLWLSSKRTDHQLLLLCDEAILAGLNEDRKSALAQDYDMIISISNYAISNEIETAPIELSARFDITAVIALSEIDMIRASRIRDALGLTQNQEAAARIYRDKFEMKAFAEQISIPVARSRKVDNAVDLISAQKLFGFPFVIKPRLEGGAMGVEILRNQNDVKNYLAKPMVSKSDAPALLLAEEYINQPMYHVDGLVVGGEFKTALVSRYIAGCMAYKNDEVHGSELVPEGALSTQMIEFTKRFTSKTPELRDFAFHAEYFVNESTNEISLCEIACRHGGGRIRDLLLEVTGLDIPAMSVRAQGHCNLKETRFPIHGERFGAYLMLHPRPGSILSTPTNPTFPWLKDFRFKAVPGTVLKKAFHSGDELSSCIILAENPVEQNSRIEIMIAVLEKFLTDETIFLAEKL